MNLNENKVSNFLYLFKNNIGELLAYNGINNSFMKLNKDLYKFLSDTKNDNTQLKQLDKNTYNILKKSKVICTQKEIDDAINQKKILRQYDTFNNNYLNLTIAPTSSCNFSCPYCFEKGIEHKTMNNDIVSNLIDFIKTKSSNTNKKVSITWYGGEPLLAIDKIIKIYKEILKNEIEIIHSGIITNAYFLNERNIEELKKIKVRFIQITLDGSNLETHNKRRFTKDGKGSWDVILKNIDVLLSKDIELDNISIRCNIDHKNKAEFDELENYLLKRWNNDKRLFIHPAILDDYNKETNLECQYINDEDASLYLINNAKRKKNIPYFNYNIGGCSATRINSYLVGPEGELYKCWNDLGRKNKIIGNIKNDTIINKELLFNFLGSPTIYEDEDCLNCPLFFVCDGGCQEKRIENKINGTNHNLCHFAKTYLDEYLSAYYELKKEKKN